MWVSLINIFACRPRIYVCVSFAANLWLSSGYQLFPYSLKDRKRDPMLGKWPRKSFSILLTETGFSGYLLWNSTYTPTLSKTQQNRRAKDNFWRTVVPKSQVPLLYSPKLIYLYLNVCIACYLLTFVLAHNLPIPTFQKRGCLACYTEKKMDVSFCLLPSSCTSPLTFFLSKHDVDVDWLFNFHKLFMSWK